VEAVVVAARPGHDGVAVEVQPALEGGRSGHGGAVAVDGRLVRGRSIEGAAAGHAAGLEHRAGNGSEADAGVMGCGDTAVVVVDVVG